MLFSIRLKLTSGASLTLRRYIEPQNPHCLGSYQKKKSTLSRLPKASMGFIQSLVMLVIVVICRVQSITDASVSSTSEEAKALDALLQDYAYRALVKNPKTGSIYDGVVPSNLTGVKIAALRLRTGSLRRKGFQMYKEFKIPTGLVETPYVERLVLVYQNLGNWSTRFYQLPNYTYLAPVLGLLAYNGSNLSAMNLSELDLRASGDSISVKFEDVKSAPDGTVAKCVWFDLQGSSNLSNVTRGNTCSTTQQGHFSIVVQSTTSEQGEKKKKSKKKVWIIVGCVLGGLALLVLLLLLILWIKNCRQKKKMQQMEMAADAGEYLNMTSLGDTRAPAATFTRTQPALEHEYAP